MRLTDKEKAYKWGTSAQHTMLPLANPVILDAWNALPDDTMVLLRTDAGCACAEYVWRKDRVKDITCYSHYARLHPQVDLESGGHQVWEHKNGNLYAPMVITNTEHPSEDYPITVVYQNVITLSCWSRPFSKWHESFRRVGDLRLPSQNLTGVGNI